MAHVFVCAAYFVITPRGSRLDPLDEKEVNGERRGISNNRTSTHTNGAET